MNVSNFREGLEAIAHTGIRLTPQQAALIESSLLLLQSENKFRDIFFWGRINGVEKDYYIAFGYMNDCLRGRRFFYSLNCFEWLIVSSRRPELYERCVLSPTKFFGDPSIVLDVLMDQEFKTDEYAVSRPFKQDVMQLKEEDRLACTLAMITEEAAVIPRGALYKRVDRKTVYNQIFKGLNYREAKSFMNYQLYREPQCKWNENLLKRHNYNYPIDNFDTLNVEIPDHKSFSISVNRKHQVSLVYSLIWPGMIFMHKLNTPTHGFLYFGDGKKNLDILFMIF